MTAHRLLITLESTVAQRFNHLVEQYLENMRDQLLAREREYQHQLAEWRRRGEDLTREHSGAGHKSRESLERAKTAFAQHAQSRPVRPVGRPRAKLLRNDIARARSAVIADLIYLAMPTAPTAKNTRTAKRKKSEATSSHPPAAAANTSSSPTT